MFEGTVRAVQQDVATTAEADKGAAGMITAGEEVLRQGGRGEVRRGGARAVLRRRDGMTGARAAAPRPAGAGQTPEVRPREARTGVAMA